MNSVDKGSRMTLSARVAGTTVLVVFMVVVTTAALSYAELRRMAMMVADRTLSAQANALASDLENRLSLLASSTKTLAANSLIANALVDDLGRDIYLRNFLAGFQSAEGFDLTLSMTNFEGTPLASNASRHPLLAPRAWLAEIVDTAKGGVTIASDGENVHVVFAEPIIYANTGTAEGALVYQVRLSDWLNLKRVQRILGDIPWVAALTLVFPEGVAVSDVLRYGTDPGEAPTARATAHLPVGAVVPWIGLEMKAKPDFVQAPLDELLRSVALSSLVVLLVATLIVSYLVRNQTVRLVRLRHETEQLTDPTNQAIHFTTEGDDEVADLARSFDSLVLDLQAAYRELEERSQESLQKSEERFRAIIENSADGILTLSESGAIETVNPAAERIFGYEAEDLAGEDVSKILPERFREDHHRYLNKSKLYAPRVINRTRDLFALRKNGEEFPLELTVSPIEIDGERKYVGMLRDISERKEFENRLRTARDEAETANRAKSQFLSGMSHELRTPLNAIMGFGQLLETDPEHPLADTQKDSIHHILRGGAHLLDLINQVLDLAKIESGNLALSIEPIDTATVLTDCLTMASAMADKKGISLSTDLPDRKDMPILMADRTRLSQVLLNLLSNATKYTAEGGAVTLSCGPSPTGMCRFSVVDTGQGIPAAYQDKVFTPFNRLAEEGSATEGTGIGLAITRQIVDLMNGVIGFSSVEGKGSIFWFELPVAGKAVAVAVSSEAEKEGVYANGFGVEIPPSTVLYVEDNPANLKLMEMILGRVGELTLHSAHTAEIGIETAKHIHPDLILMDINLPGMDGVEALKVLRKIPETEDIPVVAVSANAMPHDIKLAQEVGFNAYITKPFDLPDVMAIIAQELGRTVTAVAPGSDRPTNRSTLEYAPLSADDVRKLFFAADALPSNYVSVLKGQAATLPLLIAKIRHAVTTNEQLEIENSAHTLKTNSGTFGARELWAQAQKAEEVARNGGTDDINVIVSNLEDEYDIVSPVIERLLGDLEEERG